MTELNERIGPVCEARGWAFKPWEAVPWAVSCERPPPGGYLGTMRDETWPQAQKLRRKLIAELEADS
jgi:hypothetical protein